MKPGRPTKINEKERAEILQNLEDGASLKSAAEAAGVDYTTVYRLRRSDPVFARGAKKAVQAGKMKLIRTVANAGTWQAAAWMLERRFGEEFGRKDTLNVKAKHDHIHQVRKDVAAVANDPEAMQAVRTYARRMTALSLAQSNGHSKEKENSSPDLN